MILQLGGLLFIVFTFLSAENVGKLWNNTKFNVNLNFKNTNLFSGLVANTFEYIIDYGEI